MRDKHEPRVRFEHKGLKLLLANVPPRSRAFGGSCSSCVFARVAKCPGVAAEDYKDMLHGETVLCAAAAPAMHFVYDTPENRVRVLMDRMGP